MKHLLGLAVVLVMLFSVEAVYGQTRNTSSNRERLVRAYCTTGPCDPFFTFQGGQVLLKRVKQPKLVSNRKLGKVRINSLQRVGSGPAIPSYLEAQLSGTTFYGADVGPSNCPLANTIVSGPIATSTMSCVVGAAGDAGCSGNLFFIDFTPAACSDVSQVIQNLDLEVYEGTFVGTPERRIAVAGINILGKSPDCASGGSGCP
jgi:hypothetical protein